jgi:hypothetical protein
MNIKEAEDLVRKHLSDQIGIEYHREPPVSIYGFNPEENMRINEMLLNIVSSFLY